MPQLAPAVSTLARQTMRMAFEDLERTMTPADARDSRTTTLQQVRAAALQIESQLAAQQKLRNMRRLTPLLNGLEHYANVVDVLCNGTPFLSWIWSPITLILRIASEYIEAFEEIMKGYRKIAESLGRFEILSDAFIADADFQQTLAVFYADILQFHKYAYRFVRRSGWKLLFITSWGRFQRRFDTILEDMNRHGTLIDQEANARNIAEARQMRHDIRNWREESLDQVKRDEEELASTQYRAIMSWLKIDDTEQLSIFETIWQEGTKYPGTCDWILKTQKLKSWLQRKQDTPFIWLQGNPGSGKSVISTQLVNFIQASNSRVIRHFCTYSYASSTKYDCILRSLLLQLLRTNGELVAHVYRECVLTRRSPTISTLEQLLHSLISTLSDEPRENEYIWIILDGVDECETEKQSRLVSLMNQVTGKSSSHGGTVCKVLISSRSSPLMDRCLRKKQVVSLSDEVVRVEKAIQAYASQRLRSLHERFRQLELETEDIDEIEQIIAKKAHGMFLYARLVLDYISTNIFYSGDELKESINQLPQTLADFYHKILTQILSHLDLRSVDRVRSILGWIAFSKRPLKKLEFLSALTFSSGDATVGRLAPRFLQSCQNGVAITQHEALREHGLATVTCLLAGLQVFNAAYNEQTRLLRLVKGVHGFHIYATEYWTEYLLNEGATSGGLDPTSSLCTLATQLTSKLEGTVSSTALTHIKDNAATLDERLKYLHNHEILRRHVECALLSRSRKRLESEVLLNDKQGIKRAKPASTSSILDGISVMLEVYQQAVEYLLNQDSCPGASAEELDCFKSQFRASAYTCRLRSCPRATVGFETERLRQEHEVAHTGGFRCSFPTCQYPPLKSSQALQMHVDKYHNPKPWLYRQTSDASVATLMMTATRFCANSATRGNISCATTSLPRACQRFTNVSTASQGLWMLKGLFKNNSVAAS
ncbi:hypothetical protein BDV95DRAFT_630472 [Massariosphaeria phaeospora]|uniref:Uncharacterized protein n=1 Tax=Massariosphaeria phaeospora TaxID=100035 RepID=A0A7C8I5P3_9PLEO|nr:hypothetical protein BDV95DRAFT_630472 [Massariosphaeria phaeospora]